MSGTICYVYGVVPGKPDIADAPRGLEDKAVTLVSGDTVSAMVTRLPEKEYSPEILESQTGDVDWVGPRAIAHDRVVTWASDAGPVVPFPMWTLYRDVRGVRSMLSERAGEFVTALRNVENAREYSVRVFVNPREFEPHIAELSPSIQESEREAESASPGQRYLKQRKLAEELTKQGRALLREIASDALDRLSAAAERSVRHNLPAETPQDKGRAILYSAFLVRNDRLRDFQSAVTELVKKYGSKGFSFDFTGPWPPYNFVGGKNAE